ncbi:Similar to Lipase 1; acc. no. P79066 [Pyronema omphalodes CBS 100304]|uniref:Carboxylic ester hydrolase n=1 Tax=Pyronema omphalodes (strain CBS 100304) TaxID=1076935 RepID=U4L645_PYROM|nr:Similar to Lipase 1; acc. no. P79066 [Pyronema omphalodes CBS 100304]
MVWIYGGAFFQGSIADPRYNMSYIVKESVEAGHPVMTVAVNYRLAGFGFLFSQEVMNSRNTNLGLRDQRIALQWIQKNIKAFGGDPNRVTIWGESAGAYSIGDHLVSYGGASSGLFHQAILESGNAVGPPLNDTRWYQPKYNRIISATGCADASDTLECLRSVPYNAIYKVPEMGNEWYPIADGDMIREWPSAAIREGRFQKMPLLLGQNTDEGTSFAALGQNTDEDIVRMLQCSTRWTFTPHQAKTLISLYSTDPTVGCPYGTGNRTFEELGKQYKRYASMVGDMMMDGPRRFLASEMAKYEKNVYSYRFDAWSKNDTDRIGVGHFQEVAYVMENPQFLGTDKQTLSLSKQMARMWTSFAATGNPGGGWERYDRSNPKNLVLRLDKSYMEEDNYRKKAIEWIMGLLR